MKVKFTPTVKKLLRWIFGLRRPANKSLCVVSVVTPSQLFALTPCFSFLSSRKRGLRRFLLRPIGHIAHLAIYPSVLYLSEPLITR